MNKIKKNETVTIIRLPNGTFIHSRVTPIIVEFKGKETVNEVYQLHLKEFKDSIGLLSSHIELEKARLEAIEILAVIVNKQNSLSYEKDYL